MAPCVPSLGPPVVFLVGAVATLVAAFVAVPEQQAPVAAAEDFARFEPLLLGVPF